MAGALWFYPDPASPVRKLSAFVAPNDLQVDTVYARSSAVSLDGGVKTAIHAGYERVRIVVERRSERAAGSTWRDEAESLLWHLESGGAVTFALDEAAAYAYPVTGTAPYSTGLSLFGTNILSGLAPSAAPAADDRVVLSSALPEFRREGGTVASFSAPTLTLDNKVAYDHRLRSPIVRHWGCFPALRLAPEAARPLFQSERGFVFTLALDLVQSPADLTALHDAFQVGGIVLAGTGVTPSATSVTLGDVFRRFRPEGVGVAPGALDAIQRSAFNAPAQAGGRIPRMRP